MHPSTEIESHLERLEDYAHDLREDGGLDREANNMQRAIDAIRATFNALRGEVDRLKYLLAEDDWS